MKIACPHCQGRIKADDSQQGQQANCPHCGKEFTVPAPESDSPPPARDKDNENTPHTSPPVSGGDFSGSTQTAWKKVADGVGHASGLEKLEGFSVSALFSQVFSKHTPEEIESRMLVGTQNTTPRLQDIDVSWPTPWIFCRVLAMSLVGSLALYWAIGHFENPKLIPGWIFIGCFGIPFATLLFFFEGNILRNVSLYRVQVVLILGGILSLIFSLFLYDQTFLDEWIGFMAAGPIEEAGKLIAVIYFTRKWSEDYWILNGLLFGAAVGTGFSAFESAGFVFESWAFGGDIAADTLMAVRAFLSPFTHPVWTAATAAALWRVKGKEKFAARMLIDRRFLRVFLIVVLLHMVWNSPLTIPLLGETVGYFTLRIALGIVGWIIVFLLIQAGLKEAQLAQAQPKYTSIPDLRVAEGTSIDTEGRTRNSENYSPSEDPSFHYLGPNNEPVGPISSDVLLQFRESGVVTDETLVAPEGESEWKPLRSFLEVVEESQA